MIKRNINNIKKVVLTLLVVLFSMNYNANFVLAAENTLENNQTVNTENNNISPQGVYLRELVGYDSTTNSTNWTYKEVGSVSADNTGANSPIVIKFVYNTSGTITGTFGASITTKAQKDIIIAEISSEASVSVSASRSWTAGQGYEASITVPAGKKEIIIGYIPAVTSSGSLKYKVHMDGYSDYWYEYKSISNIFVPAKTSVHFVHKNL